MLIINHRCNTRSQLQCTPPEEGVETDIRTHYGKLVVTHDPFCDGELFEDWLEDYKHKFLVLNVKEEGLESFILPLLKRFSIKNFAFLDQSIPYLYKWSSKKVPSFIRYSDLEPIELALNFSDQVKWVWVDYFKAFSLTKNDYNMLKRANLNICFVSPELHGIELYELEEFIDLLISREIFPVAVCTKESIFWRNFFKNI